MNNLSNIIKFHKDKCNITLQELSSRTGIALSTLSKIINGTTKSIKTETLIKIANVLDFSIEEINNHMSKLTKSNEFFGFVKVCAVSLDVSLANPLENSHRIVNKVKELYEKGVKIAAFQELGLTGYTCGDLFYHNTLQNGALKGLNHIINQTSSMDILFAIGIPLNIDNLLYNCAVVLHKGVILAVIPKTFLPNYNEFYEKRQFYPAPNTTRHITLLNQTVAFGTDVIIKCENQPSIRIAVEICEDLWTVNPPSSRHSINGANIILNLSASNECVGKGNYRSQLVSSQSARCVCAYIYSSASLGESTSDIVFSGHNIIAENGKILSSTDLFSTDNAICEIDTVFLDSERIKLFNNNYNTTNYTVVKYNGIISNPTQLERVFPKLPFVPMGNRHLDKRSKEILNIQAYALASRIKHINTKSLVIGVSGGLDSALALLVCVRSIDIIKGDRKNIIAVTMPCFGTTKRTKTNSEKLAESLGVTLRVIDISASVKSHLKDINHDSVTTDITYENAQARERTQVLMDIANQTNGIVIGTGDMSELALGWATYNGDHMSMYGVNCSIPKTLIKHLVRYEANRLQSSAKAVLLDILDTPVSPELIPHKNNTIVQVTEDIVGPYILHDFFMFCLVRLYYSPSKILYLSHQVFEKDYDLDTIYKWLNVFIKRFFAQQFKRNCLPDGIKVGSVSLSPRGDLRMPSDAKSSLWLRELQSYYNSIVK